MMKATILVCALALPTDECNKQTATHVILAPKASSPAGCGMQSQAYVAETSLAAYDDHYVKVICQFGGKMKLGTIDQVR